MSLQVEARLDAAPTYQDLSDGDLVARARGGDERALERLLTKYQHLVKNRTGGYFLPGADREDLLQEGMLGLYFAIRDFRPEKLVAFPAFAAMCVTRQVITAVKTASRRKHAPLNSSLPYDRPLSHDSDHTLIDVLGDGGGNDPAQRIMDEDAARTTLDRLRTHLSTLEQQVLAAYLEGKSYRETAVDLQLPVKTVDNALQRVKHKLVRYFEPDDIR